MSSSSIRARYGNATLFCRKTSRIERRQVSLYDSGDFLPAFERALELAEYDGFRQQQRARGSQQSLIGIGVATVVKASGGRGEMKTSQARVRVEPTGHIKVYTEVSPHGEGTETTFAQIAADELGVRVEDVGIAWGYRHAAGRSGYLRESRPDHWRLGGIRRGCGRRAGRWQVSPPAFWSVHPKRSCSRTGASSTSAIPIRP